MLFASHSCELFGVKKSQQLCLQGLREFTDFVQEQRATLGQLQKSSLAALRSRESAPFAAKAPESASVPLTAAQFIARIGPIRPFRLIVNISSQVVLATATLP